MTRSLSSSMMLSSLWLLSLLMMMQSMLLLHVPREFAIIFCQFFVHMWSCCCCRCCVGITMHFIGPLNHDFVALVHFNYALFALVVATSLLFELPASHASSPDTCHRPEDTHLRCTQGVVSLHGH